MASYPIDSPATAPAETTLRQIAELYESALAAVQNSELEQIQGALDRIDLLTKSLVEPLDAKLLAQISNRHGHLLTALAAERAKSKNAIEQSSQGRKALRGYGNRGPTTGTQLESLS